MGKNFIAQQNIAILDFNKILNQLLCFSVTKAQDWPMYDDHRGGGLIDIRLQDMAFDDMVLDGVPQLARENDVVEAKPKFRKFFPETWLWTAELSGYSISKLFCFVKNSLGNLPNRLKNSHFLYY